MTTARSCGFVKRKPRKLYLSGFVFSCLGLALQDSGSFRNQAILAGLVNNTVLSKQALFKRLTPKAVSFMEHVLAAVISWKVGYQVDTTLPFARILVQDSTCVSLASKLAEKFPGPSNQAKSGQASLRIQAVYDLLTERFVAFSLGSFRRNDQAAAGDLVALLKPADLVLRDLGYFTLDSLKRIAAKGAFYLTRLHYGAALLCPQSGEELNLAKILSPGQKLDKDVWLGKKEKLPIRLLAFPLPEEVANERRRKARANRDKRLNHSKDYMYLLGWTILLTNASEERLPYASAEKLYRLRWRIEILFKAWKSHLCLKHLKQVGARQVEVLVYGLLLLAVLTHHIQSLPEVESRIPKLGADGKNNPISILRLTEFLGHWLIVLMFVRLAPGELEQRLAAQLDAHCRYDSRIKRTHYFQKRGMALS